MNPSQLYACAMGGIILWLLVSRIIRVWAQRQHWPLGIVWLGGYLYRKIIFFVLRHLIYPQVFRTRSRCWVLLQSIYWAGTLTCNFIKTDSLSSIAARAGNLAVLNFVPLVVAGRLSLVSDLLGLPIRSYVGMHGTLGIMTCIQTALHTTLTIRNRGWSPEHPVQFYGLLALSAFCLSIALLIIRGYLYEIFIKMHYILALAALVAVWRHVRLQKAFAQIYMVVGSGILIGTTLLHWAILLVRNITLKQFGSRAQVHRGDGWAQVVIPVNRPFTVHAGMTVYIWMPGVSPFSMFYSHPFTVTWWELNKQGKATSISILVQKKDGFTQSLVDHPGREFLTWIDGPYGERIDLSSYNNVLLVASGIGIAAQIPYIRELLNHRPKRIFVAWELDDKSNLNWVYQWMDQLLLQDQESYILRFGLYLPSRSNNSEHPEPWNSKHDRIWKLSGEIDPWKVVSTDFWRQSGTSLVTVSANKRIRKGITEVIQNKMEHVVDLLELPFQPGNPQMHQRQKTSTERV
ncbi:ferric reductase family protein [Aspergillus novofumigatus IBT 16806]|uniref:FAD-binding domain-containing protein n=1 Tax=Aspergillus novofumigatus (strain IBT 16806) TaxID=1392255 RepID=A0A2I1C1F1_ASPN1|nr:FAD-binding domain-containing protein [Aspergillus novofumigatus IBT 16806]PKX91411.1 FAD-binding domain-containing protein [Aspergillus novofumigatus IBT 16806]